MHKILAFVLCISCFLPLIATKIDYETIAWNFCFAGPCQFRARLNYTWPELTLKQRKLELTSLQKAVDQVVLERAIDLNDDRFAPLLLILALPAFSLCALHHSFMIVPMILFCLPILIWASLNARKLSIDSRVTIAKIIGKMYSWYDPQYDQQEIIWRNLYAEFENKIHKFERDKEKYAQSQNAKFDLKFVFFN